MNKRVNRRSKDDVININLKVSSIGLVNNVLSTPLSYSQIVERALVAERAEQRITHAQEARRLFRQGQGHH